MSSTLVTLGCSFSQGDGCYDLSLGWPKKENGEYDIPKSYPYDKKDFMIEFRERNINKMFNQNSIGANIQKRFGYEKYLNYAFGGYSNLSQFFRFLNNLPTEDNVTIIWQLTFYHRRMQVIGKFAVDAGLHCDWISQRRKENMENHKLSFQQLDDSDRYETLLYIDALNNICKERGWNLLVWSWVKDEYKRLQILGKRVKDIIIPFDNPLDGIEQAPQEYHCVLPWDGHPNEKGYKLIANQLCDIIEENNMLDIPNDTPKEMKRLKEFSWNLEDDRLLLL